MKAYVTSIGEKTTEICVSQLKRCGYEVVLIDGKESWYKKFCRFIDLAAAEGADCVRVDADCIVNMNFRKLNVEHDVEQYRKQYMHQYQVFDFYKNDVQSCMPIVYSWRVFDIIKEAIAAGRLDENRPETSAWRLPEVNGWTTKHDIVVGMHGFFQRQEDFERHFEHREDRGQLDTSDFELAKKLFNISKQ